MKTAVEFAFEELNKWRIETFGEFALIGIPQEVLDKAKEKEKEQMFKALVKGTDVHSAYDIELEFNEYYNETYKNKEQ
jgi:hypothetical protein